MDEPGRDRERNDAIQQLHDWVDTPMAFLGFLWLGLIIVDLIRGLPRSLTYLSTAIWVVFIAEFLLEAILAPAKKEYLKKNWLAALSLFVPAFRLFRVFRLWRILTVARATRGLRLLTIVTSVNRGMAALKLTMKRRGFGYVLLLTILVTFTGGAGMFAFEQVSEVDNGFTDYWSALWWTAMIMTTMGSQYWPQTVAGQVLCLFLATYAFAVFGYVTATLASFFVERDAVAEDSRTPTAQSIDALKSEITALRAEISK